MFSGLVLLLVAAVVESPHPPPPHTTPTTPRPITVHESLFFNNCAFTVWPAIRADPGQRLPLRGGFPLEQNKTRKFILFDGWSGEIWPRTDCEGSGRSAHCATGDCGRIECRGNAGKPPFTTIRFALDHPTHGIDQYNVSLLDGYNLPVAVEPIQGTFWNGSSTDDCETAGCLYDLNAECPDELALKDEGGWTIACKSPCLAFDTDEYCCRGTFGTRERCDSSKWPVDYASIFKRSCPDSYSFRFDDPNMTYRCRSKPKTGYLITFCP